MLCSVWNIEEKLNLGGQMFNLKQYIILYKFTMNEAWSALTIPFIFTHIKKSIGPLDELLLQQKKMGHRKIVHSKSFFKTG